MSKHLTRDLAILEHASRTLAEAKTLDEIKSIRDKAEAARQYAKSAALGLQIQNFAAELKLRAERKAGSILAELSLRGGNRKSQSHRESLKLADLGIDHNKSARWQLAALIPESVFLAYLAAAEESGTEITTQGLLRLATKATVRRRHDRDKYCEHVRHNGDTRPRGTTAASRLPQDMTAAAANNGRDEAPSDIVTELEHQRKLLATILTPFCEGRQPTLAIACKRTVVRLLDEMQDLLSHLMTTLS